MVWLSSDMLPQTVSGNVQNAITGNTADPQTMRAILQELIGTFLFVFFYLAQSEKESEVSSEKAINCLVIAAAFVSARAMVMGQLGFAGELSQQTGLEAGLILGVSTYGAMLNPSMATCVCSVSVWQSSVDATFAFKYIWIYIVFPIIGSVCAVIFYDYAFKTAQHEIEMNKNPVVEEEAAHEQQVAM